MLRVLLICGAGASTGFLAQSARMAAKQKQLEMKIEAKSTAHLESYMNDIDVLLLGSHFSYKEDEVRQEIAGKGIVFGVVPQKIFGSIDGAGLVDYIQELCAESGKKL